MITSVCQSLLRRNAMFVGMRDLRFWGRWKFIVSSAPLGRLILNVSAIFTEEYTARIVTEL